MRSRSITRRTLVKALSGAPLASALPAPAPGRPQTGWRVGSTAERLREKPYRKRLCRVENYPACLLPGDSPVGVTVEEYADLIADAGVEVQIVAGEQNRGTPRFRSKMLPPHPYVERDRLPRFLELAHRRGIVVLTYISMNYCKPLRPLHPEWMMRFLDDGRPEPENLGWFCFNSPFRDWRPVHLAEYLDNLDLDGFYFDDMNWGSHEDKPYYTGCCCRYCEELYRRDTGLAIPTRVDLGSLDFKRFVNWRYDRFRDFLAHVTRKIKEKHPDAVADFNYYGRHQGDWTLGHPLNPLGLEKVGAHFFIETKQAEDGSSFSAKTARAHGAPFAIWRHAVQTLPESVGSSAPYPEPLSPTIHGLAGLANGGAAVYGMFDGPMPLRRDMMKALFREIRRRAEYAEGETVKYAALHYSQQLRDFRPAPGPAQVAQYGLRATKGAYDLLNQSHVLVDIVLDEQLALERLAPYRVLVLSNSACLSDAQCEAIRRYVRAGGTLVATHQTSLFDELGRRRETFGLADVLGLDYREPAAAGAVHGIVMVPHEEALRRQFGYVVSFVGEESTVAARSAGLRVLCTRARLDAKRPLDVFDTRADYAGTEPAATEHAFGGGRAFYIGGDAGAGFMHNPYPPLKRFVAALVRRTRAPIEFQAPKAIEVSALTRGGRELVVHLLNNPTPWVPFTTPFPESTTYLYLEEVNPIRDVRIRFNDLKVRRARLPLDGRELAITGTPPEVVVPEIALHQVVVAELAG